MKSERNLKQETKIAIIEHKEKAKLTKWYSSAHRKLKTSVTFAIILEFVSGGGIFATDFVAIFLFAFFPFFFTEEFVLPEFIFLSNLLLL